MVKQIHMTFLAAMDLPRQWIFRTVERFRIGPQMFLVLLATVIGALTGLGAVSFLLLIRLVKLLFFGILLPTMASAPYLIFLLPALGGLVIGPLIHS